MTTFYIDPLNLEKWIHQNDAHYLGDFLEGSLLDNFILYTDKGFAAFYEHYLTPWQSNYYVEFEKGTAQNVFKNWHAFENNYLYQMKILGY